MEKDIEERVLEAKPLFEQGRLTIDDIVAYWLSTAKLYKSYQLQNADLLELIQLQNETIERLTHALLAQKSNYHA